MIPSTSFAFCIGSHFPTLDTREKDEKGNLFKFHSVGEVSGGARQIKFHLNILRMSFPREMLASSPSMCPRVVTIARHVATASNKTRGVNKLNSAPGKSARDVATPSNEKEKLYDRGSGGNLF